MGIPLETGQKQYSVDYKLETYLKIARLFLEDDDPIQAEAYINRASLLQGREVIVVVVVHDGIENFVEDYNSSRVGVVCPQI